MAVPIRWAVCFVAFLTATETARPRVDVATVRAQASAQKQQTDHHDVSEDVKHEDTGSVAEEVEAANTADDVARGTHTKNRSTHGAADDVKEARVQASLQKHSLATKNAIAQEDASVSNDSSLALDLFRNHSDDVKMYSGNDTAGCDMRTIVGDLTYVACKLVNDVGTKLVDKAIDAVAGGICGLFSGQMAGLCTHAAACAGCAVGFVCPALAGVAALGTGCGCYNQMKSACTSGVTALINRAAGNAIKKALTIQCTPSRNCFDAVKFHTDYGDKMAAKLADAIAAYSMDFCSWVKKEANALMGG